MNAKQVNFMLWSGAVAVTIAAAGSLLYGFAVPLERREIVEAPKPNPTTKAAVGNALPPPSAFEKIWAMSLRQPLGDAPPPGPVQPQAATMVSPPVPVVTSGVPVSLVGTIGTSLAMLKTMNNSVEVCAVGESFGGVTVVAVRPAEVDVRFNGQVIKLSKPADSH
jgi:hypothetical protein